MWVGDLRLGAGIGAWGGWDQEAGEKGVVAVMCQITKKKKKKIHIKKWFIGLTLSLVKESQWPPSARKRTGGIFPPQACFSSLASLDTHAHGQRNAPVMLGTSCGIKLARFGVTEYPPAKGLRYKIPSCHHCCCKACFPSSLPTTQDSWWCLGRTANLKLSPAKTRNGWRKQRAEESNLEQRKPPLKSRGKLSLTISCCSQWANPAPRTQPRSAWTRFLQHREDRFPSGNLLSQPLSILGLTSGRQRPFEGDTEGPWGGLGVVAAGRSHVPPHPDAAAMCCCGDTQVALRLWETENGHKLCLSQGCPTRSVMGFFSSLEKARINTRSKISPCPFSGRNGLPSGETFHQGKGEREEVMQWP